MTKRLDPDLRAIRAISRALRDLPDNASRKRVIEWVVAYTLNIGGYSLPDLRFWRRLTWDVDDEKQP